ncbi:hypothetical protein B6I21_06935 [candidate division KSB1 bacterium 4572_119]|nr:MAG: hypothetical protein B6I21_06935 [candidate division KSB1 bacterium 4572_119]
MARIRKRDLVNIFFRSFFIQAAWSYERMLGLGFCYCLIPIARRLFKDRKKQAAFLKRHLDFFNSHPYMANYSLGAVANIEQQAILKNWDDIRPVEVFKKRVIGPLGSIGDTLFWQLLLPFFGALGVLMLIGFKTWGALFFLLFYNFFHLFIRFRGLVKSYKKGFDIIRDLSLRGTKKYFISLQYTFSGILGVGIIVLLSRINQIEYAVSGKAVFLISLLFSFLMVRRQKISIDFQIIIAIISSLLVGLMLTP